MRFDCGETGEEWEERLSSWHTKFLWWPTKIGDHDCRWLEKINRKGTPRFCWGAEDQWDWEYKEIYNEPDKS